MGVVYKAQDTKLDRFVALKFLPAHLSQAEEEKKRFIHEAIPLCGTALDHNNICTIYEIDETEDGQMFIAMACYEGSQLESQYTVTNSVGSVLERMEPPDRFNTVCNGVLKFQAVSHLTTRLSEI
jgi:serine/threonine protein kinase